MSYSFDFLNFRNNDQKSPLQICWWAATTKNFVGIEYNKVSKQEINAVDLINLCDEIRKGFLGVDDAMPLFNLRISSQLMYGAVRIFYEKLLDTEDISEKTFIKMIEVSKPSEKTKLEKKKKIFEKHVNFQDIDFEKILNESLPEIDIINILSRTNNEDVNLMMEQDFPEVETNLLSFGSIGSYANIDELITEIQNNMSIENNFALASSPSHSNFNSNIQTNKNVDPMDVDNQDQQSKDDSTKKSSKTANLMKTPKRIIPKRSGIPEEQSSPSETARTAFSPPVNKKPLLMPTQLPNLQLSPLPKSVLSLDDNIEMEIIEPIAEAALPDHSPTPQLFQMSKDASALPAVSQNMPIESLCCVPDVNLDHILESNEERELNDADKDFKMEDKSTKASLITKNFKKFKRGKKRFFDTQIELSYTKIPNVNICKASQPKIELKIESAKTLLSLPSTLKRRSHMQGRLWSSTLLNLYRENIQEPCPYRELKKISEDREESCEDMEVEEIPRAAPVIVKEVQIILNRLENFEKTIKSKSFLRSRIEHMNTESGPQDNFTSENNVPAQFIDDDVPMNGDLFDVAGNLSANVNQQQMNNNEQPEDDDNDNGANDDVMAPALKKFKINEETESMANAKEDNLNDSSKSNFLATVKEFWNEHERDHENDTEPVKVSFSKLVKPESNGVINAIQSLMHCFNLERERKLDLEQEKPYSTLYLKKPN